MVARKAHNLETWFESNGRNYFICCRGELLHYKIFNQVILNFLRLLQ